MVVEAVLCENVVDLWVLDGAEDQCLAVVLGPIVQVGHPHTGEVHPMGIRRLQVQVLQHMLKTGYGMSLASLKAIHEILEIRGGSKEKHACCNRMLTTLMREYD